MYVHTYMYILVLQSFVTGLAVDKPVLSGWVAGEREASHPAGSGGGCGRWAWPKTTGNEPGMCQNGTACMTRGNYITTVVRPSPVDNLRIGQPSWNGQTV